MTFGPTKGHERREVPLPRFLLEDLARHVGGPRLPTILSSRQRGAAMRSGTFQRGALTEAASGFGIPGLHRTS